MTESTPPQKLAPKGSALQAQNTIPASQIQASNLDSLGKAYAIQGKYKEAINYFQQALAAAQTRQDTWGEGMATQILNNLGVTYFLTGNLEQSEQRLLEVVKRAESQRDRIGDNEVHNVQFFDTQQSYSYRTLQQVLVAQGRPEAALEMAERGRARVFVEQLARRSSSISRKMQPLVSIQAASINNIRRIAKTQNATLVTYSLVPEAAELFEGRNRDELRNAPKKLFIWVVQPSGQITFREQNLRQVLEKNMTLAKLVQKTRQAIRAREPIHAGIAGEPKQQTALAQQLRQLHTILIEPIAEFLPKSATESVIFMPQESLLLLPFGALLDDNGHYLIQSHTFWTAPSIQVLEWTHQRRRQVQAEGLSQALVLGNPTMPTLPGEREPLARLPGAELEANAVTKLLCGQGSHDQNQCPVVLTGAQATKAAVLKQMVRSRIIHLATHGVLDHFHGTGVPGAIALAPTEQDDGWLKANEILDLQLKAELVVLSACDTGRGSIRADGVIGLSRVFITAGVPNVLVSLWAISDDSTAAMMSEFYHQYQQKGLSQAQALRQAQMTLIQNKNITNESNPRSSLDKPPGNDSTRVPIPRALSHPFYWAPFILNGNG